MIIREQPASWKLMFIMRGSVIPTIWPQILTVSIFSLLTAGIYQSELLGSPQISITAFAVFGIALSLFLGFRNNAAYERWWEARKEWGHLVENVRGLARSTEILLGAEHSSRQLILNDAIAFAYYLNANLRHKAPISVVEKFIDPATQQAAANSANPADFMLRRISQHIANLYLNKDIDSIGVQVLNQHLTAVTAVQAASERIANTPLPFAYSLLVRRTAYLYCFLIPFGLVGSIGWLTPLFAAIIAYIFFGLNALSEELETPFSSQLNSIPLDSLCRMMEISVAEALNTPPPEPIQPKAFHLS